MKGPTVKTCGGTRNGAWTQKNKIPRCVDVTPPNIVCPKNYSIELSGNKSFVLLSQFKELELVEGEICSKVLKSEFCTGSTPKEESLRIDRHYSFFFLIQDNSGTNVSFWVKPALKEGGTKMYAGNYTFTYVAVDDFKNKAKCNFTISIADNTPPTFENCVMNQTFYVASKNNTSQMIEWEEPFAYDNVDDKNITIESSLRHGFLSPGDYVANYTAVDKTGNANSCIINITVKEKKCNELEKPENGQRICAKNETTTWCDFRCNFGYGITENDSVIENVVLDCDNEKRIWSSDSVPECSLVEQPNSVEEVLTISLHSESLLCEDFAQNVN